MSSISTLEEFGTTRAFGAAATRSEGVTKWIERTSSIPPGVAWAVNAGIWFADMETFREAEDEALVVGSYSAKLDEHRLILSKLIARGERLLLSAKQITVPADFSLFSANDVRSAVASLHTTLRCQHGPKTHPKVDSEISKLFDVEKSGV